MKRIYFILMTTIFLLDIGSTYKIAASSLTSNETSLILSEKKAKKKKEKSTDEYLWPKGPSVYAEAAILMEASTGTILYEKNIHDTYYPASITKILTTLVALENSTPDEVVTYSKNAIFGIERNSSHIWLDIGESITMEQSLYAIMLESANEAAYGVGEHIAGDLDSFVDMMNDKATSLGCNNSHFMNTNGLHHDKHYTSAYDMALISRAALSNSTFRTITSTRSYQIPPTNKQSETRYLVNHHKMALTANYANAKPYEGCFGGKTGFTIKAQNTLVTFAKRGNLELISVILKSNLANQYEDSKLLLDYGFDNYVVYNIAEEEGYLSGDNSGFLNQYNIILNADTSPIQLNKSGNIVMPKNATYSNAIKTVSLNTEVTTSASSTSIGEISFTYGNKNIGSATIEYVAFPLKNQSTVTKGLNNQDTSSPLLENFYESLETKNISSGTLDNDGTQFNLRFLIIGIIIVVLVGIYVVYYMVIELPRLKRRKNYYRKRLDSKNKGGF